MKKTNEEKEKCEHCFKVYISKYNLNRHKLSCKAKKADDINKEKEKDIEELEREKRRVTGYHDEEE
jgi:hypothetical protein